MNARMPVRLQPLSRFVEEINNWNSRQEEQLLDFEGYRIYIDLRTV